MNIEMINQTDIAFIVDTTSSMQHLIDSARRNMISMVDELTKKNAIDMRFATVEYRDHPPEEKTFVVRVHEFSADRNSINKTIAGLNVSGGGDAAEAVFDGLISAANKLNWRPHARRVAVLVGDAPPHGTGHSSDNFAKGCPCGETIQSTTAALEQNKVTLYAIALNDAASKSFTELALFTGGDFFMSVPQKAIAAIGEILEKEFGDIEFDKKVLSAWLSTPSIDEIAKSLDTNRIYVAASVSRLGKRDFIQQP